MADKLTKTRHKIDKVNLKLAKLLVKRNNLTSIIQVIKDELKLPPLNKIREAEQLSAINKKYPQSMLANYFKFFFTQAKFIQCRQKIALVGENLTYSYSPYIHKIISKISGLNYQFELLPTMDFNKTLTLLKEYNYRAFFITMPYKQVAISNNILLTYHAANIGAVNLIYHHNNILIGDNTDYDAFINTFNPPIIPKVTPYILGNGASAKMINYALNNLGYQKVIKVALKPADSNTISYEQFAKEKPQLLINATPVGMCPQINDTQLLDNINDVKYYYDLIYNPTFTLDRQKLLPHCLSTNGLQMLITQAIIGVERIFDIHLPDNIKVAIMQTILTHYEN